MVLPKACGVRRFLGFSRLFWETCFPRKYWTFSSIFWCSLVETRKPQILSDWGRIEEESHVAGHVAEATTRWQQTVILSFSQLSNSSNRQLMLWRQDHVKIPVLVKPEVIVSYLTAFCQAGQNIDQKSLLDIREKPLEEAMNSSRPCEYA